MRERSGQPESIPPRLQIEYDLLLELSQAISTTLDLGALVQVIADGTARVLGVETTALYLLEDNELVLAATTPPLPADMPQSLRRAKRADHPHAEQALTAQQPLVLADTTQAALSAAERAVVEQRKLRSLLFLPFGQAGVPVGILILGTMNEQRGFGAHEIDLCRTLANQLALAVQNARLHSGLKEYAARLERQLAEQTRLEEHLRHAQKMEAVGQLAGGVAHDFNNLLQIIAGYSDTARAELPMGGEARASLGLVLEAVRRASALVRQLLTLARRQALSLEGVNLNQAVEALLPMLRPLLGERINLSAHLGADPACVLADRSQLELILVNLCVNARDAMPEGGGLTILTERVKPGDACLARVDLPGPGPYLRLAVTDTGRGMDAETRQRAFEPFFTTKELGAGTGLGLSMVHGLVTQHGGVANIVSELGQGTTVEIVLPAVASTECTAVVQPTTEIAGGPETILFAEDDELVRRLTAQMLTSAGYSVLLAADGLEAVSLIAQHARRIDLALLDLVMPKLGGLEVCRALHSQRPGVPVVFASGQGFDAASDSVTADAAELIHKPYSREDLLGTIRRVLDASAAGAGGGAPAPHAGGNRE
jgi:signal transduction histidine kinase/ActR/RegA family two-component response regulator